MKRTHEASGGRAAMGGLNSLYASVENEAHRKPGSGHGDARRRKKARQDERLNRYENDTAHFLQEHNDFVESGGHKGRHAVHQNRDGREPLEHMRPAGDTQGLRGKRGTQAGRDAHHRDGSVTREAKRPPKRDKMPSIYERPARKY